MLEGGDDELTRAHIQTVILNQYDRLGAEMSEASAKALTVAATPDTTSPSPLPRSLNWGSSARSLMASAPSSGGEGTAVRRSATTASSGSQVHKAANCSKR